jgi:hypothetical protein
MVGSEILARSRITGSMGTDARDRFADACKTVVSGLEAVSLKPPGLDALLATSRRFGLQYCPLERYRPTSVPTSEPTESR